MDIADKVKEIISQQLDVDKANIKDDASFIDDLVRFARSAPPGRAILRAAPAIPAPVLG